MKNFLDKSWNILKNSAKNIFKALKEFLPILVSFFALFLANATLDFTATTDIAVEVFIEESMKDFNLEDQTKLTSNVILRRQNRYDDLNTFELNIENENAKTEEEIEEEIEYHQKLIGLDDLLNYIAEDEKYFQLGVEGILKVMSYLIFFIFIIQIFKSIYDVWKPNKQ